MSHIYQRCVQFADTDAAGVVHFSRLLCYAEEAEHDLLRRLGIPLLGNGGWPRVHVDCDYLAPVRPGESVEVAIYPEEIGRSSVLWTFAVSVSGTEVARGRMKTVCVDEQGSPVEIRPEWRRELESVGGSGDVSLARGVRMSAKHDA